MTRGRAGDGAVRGDINLRSRLWQRREQRDPASLPSTDPCIAPHLCTAPRWIRMVAPRRHWAPLVSLTCCVALLVGHLAGAAPMHPKYPGDDAPVEELAQFYNELQQYLNMITRPRYGKRSSSRTLGGDPYDAPGC
ncbi:pancreatic polypeptide-like [Emydura macquarii macquarii]|uniref:pancreatic polypeptide-like n=1 Tax=Emydura macquarii macquarii TaxID=1129001 RepID=UPI00352B3FC2